MITRGGSHSAGGELAQVLPKDPRPWYKIPHLLRLNLLILCIIQYSSAGGYDGSMMNGLQSLQQWQEFMGHPTGAWLGFITSAQSIGQLLGFPPAAWVMNRYGRKTAIYIGVFFIMTGSILQCAAVNTTMFWAARIIVGCGSGWIGAAPTLISEIAYPTQRGPATALYNCAYYVGTTLAASITFGTRNYTTSWAWRLPSLLQLLVPLLFLPALILTPESPRWLVHKGRISEAREMLIKYHAGGDSTSPLVSFELSEICRTIQLEKEAKVQASYISMIQTKGNRHRLFVTVVLGFFTPWSGAAVLAYYLSTILYSLGITRPTSQIQLNVCLQLFNLLISSIAAFSVDRLGRRFLLLLSSAGMLASWIVITALSASYTSTQSPAIGKVTVVMLFIYYGFNDVGFPPLLVAYPVEIWPYMLRAGGVVVVLSTALLATTANVILNPVALETIGWRYYFVYVGLLGVLVGIVWFCVPETRGRTLEDVARVFDGEDAGLESESEVEQVVMEGKDGAGAVGLRVDITEVHKGSDASRVRRCVSRSDSVTIG